jgi:6-phosphogluconolactonase
MKTLSDAYKAMIYRDPEEVAAQAAGWLHHLASASTGRFSINLCGGQTPRLLYETLARPPYLSRFPWKRVHWFWGDERFVPPDDFESNYRMVREAMLDVAPVPLENIHAVNTGLANAAASAVDYQRRLQKFYGATRPIPGHLLFDITLLGLGQDGHTASLFPKSPALRERNKWVVPTVAPNGQDRITLTFPALRLSGHIAFVVCGSAKARTVSEIFSGATFPAAQVRSNGTINWFLDEDAAPFAKTSEPANA